MSGHVRKPAPAQRWATIRVIPNLDAAHHRPHVSFDDFAGTIALDPDVSGVEIRDPALIGNHVDRYELCVYTVPSALVRLTETLMATAEAWGYVVSLVPEEHDDESWRDIWKKFYRATVFGNHQLLLRPSWIERQPDDPKMEIVLDPGRAFGTGLHATTRLCLARLCALAHSGHTFTSILDLGCGSGILSLAASQLFGDAKRLLALDIDPEAVETTRENLALNDALDRITALVGTPDATPPGERFALIVANIRTNVLVEHHRTLAARIETGGRLILSGIVDDELETVRTIYTEAGWVLDSACGGGIRAEGIWRALDLRAA